MGVMQEIKTVIGKALRPVHAGEQKLACRDARLDGIESIAIASRGFFPNGPIPRTYAQEGKNVSPPLHWAGVPPFARELVLLCEDPDAPLPHPFVHWLVYGMPASTRELPPGILPPFSLASGGLQGKNSAMADGYAGPAPPPGHGVHHYYFQIFALGAPLNLGPEAKRDEVVRAMAGHVLAKGILVGTYQR